MHLEKRVHLLEQRQTTVLILVVLSMMLSITAVVVSILA